jgi:hypothetical protein
MFFDEEQNCYFPALDVQNKIFIGADPVRSKLSHLQDKGRGSSVGMAAFRKRDYVIDPNDEDSSNWESECFVMDYRYRPEDPKESLEDMLKACVLYGAWMFGENNVKGIQDFFEEKGFAGYLLFNRDSKGKRKLEAGGATVGDFGEDLISWMMSYMSRHWKREKHIRIHEQCLEIYSRQDLTHADLFVGACYGGYAATYNSKMATRYVERETSSDSIAESFYPKFYYRV